jgi:dihydroorotate dehydrogenase (NAD+) catalytic subunit
MRLRGVEWGNVFNSAGGRSFFGEGYWWHALAAWCGLRYEGSTFVSKTTTLLPRKGNMPLDDAHQPMVLRPDCIVVKPLAGVVLNAVGLSGPGVRVLMDRWREDRRKRLRPRQMVVSYMAVEGTPKDRISEASSFFTIVEPFVQGNGTDFTALQLNFSCPNVGVDSSHLREEVAGVLDHAKRLNVVTMIKLNALVPPELACELAAHPACDAVVCSNTIPWGQLKERIDWHGLFGSDESPIARYGGGGLSGKPLLPIVEEWIADAVRAGMTKPIVGGGGILSKRDAHRLLDVGAAAVELGSVSILRPWRVAGIIRSVNERLGPSRVEDAE